MYVKVLVHDELAFKVRCFAVNIFYKFQAKILKWRNFHSFNSQLCDFEKILIHLIAIFVEVDPTYSEEKRSQRYE